MTIAATTNRTIAIGNGSQTVFSYSFFVPGQSTSDQTNLQVIITDLSGNQTTLTDTQYNLSNSISTASPGGTVTYPLSGSPLATGWTITIVRLVPYAQLTTLANQGGFYPTVVDSALDNLEMQIQQVHDQANRSIRAPFVDPGSINLTLPAAAQRASQALGFDSLGNVIALTTVPAGTISSAMAPVCAASTIANAQTLLGIGTPGFGLPYGQIYAAATAYGFSSSGTAAANTAALNAAIAALVAQGGGIVVLPEGTFALNALATITAGSVVIQGQGRGGGGTVLNFANTTGDCITFSGGQLCGIKDCCISASVIRTSGYAITITGGAYENFVDNVRIVYHYNGIFCGGASETKLRSVAIRNMFGVYGIRALGSVSNQLYGLNLYNVVCDNPYQSLVDFSNVTSWATSTGFTAGQVIALNGNIYQCASSGTSASGGSGPSGIPNVAPTSAFTTAITDGSATWYYVCSDSLKWITHDSYAYSLRGVGVVLIDGVYGFVQIDSVAAGGNASVPKWANFWELECGHNWFDGITLTNGQGFNCTQSFSLSHLRGSGIIIKSTYQGEVGLDSTRIFGCYYHGVDWHAAGAINIKVRGCTISYNSQGGSGVSQGITVPPNALHFTIVDNEFSAVDGTGLQNYAILINTGTSDHYVVVGNRCFGQVSGGVSDGGSGSNKAVSLNVV